MRSWRFCVNPALIAIAPLTAILVTTAAVSAVAAATDDGAKVRGALIPPDHADKDPVRGEDSPETDWNLVGAGTIP